MPLFMGRRSSIFLLLLLLAPSESSNQSTPGSYEQLYFSSDEQEERILSALAGAFTLSYSSSSSWSDDLTESQGSEKKVEHHTDKQVDDAAEPATTSAPATTVQYVELPGKVQPSTQARIPPPSTPVIRTGSPGSSMTTPWVRHYLATNHKDVLIPVPKDYFADNFNLAQIPPVVEQIGRYDDYSSVDHGTRHFPLYQAALRLITQDDPLPVETPLDVQRAARALYNLVHQRYILSPRGLDTVRRRFLYQDPIDPFFGRCPRQCCRGMPLLPYGDYVDFDLTESSPAKRYCASCHEVFHHWESKVDGSAWGPSFCHLFVMAHGDIFADWEKDILESTIPPTTPRVFGFELHESAKSSGIW